VCDFKIGKSWIPNLFEDLRKFHTTIINSVNLVLYFESGHLIPPYIKRSCILRKLLVCDIITEYLGNVYEKNIQFVIFKASLPYILFEVERVNPLNKFPT